MELEVRFADGRVLVSELIKDRVVSILTLI